MDDTTEEAIREIIAKQLHIEVEDITDYADIIDDLKADSLDIVEILMAIEDSFEITIPDEDLTEIRTFRDLCDYVEEVS